MKKLIATTVALVMGGFIGIASAQAQNAPAVENTQSLDSLLELVRKGVTAETAEHRKREAEFMAAKDRQADLLKKAETSKANEEARSTRLEAKQQENELKIGQLEENLNESLGSLKELFGVLQQVAGDARATFEDSVISAQYPGRDEKLDALIQKVAGGKRLPSIEEIEGLWFEIQREMTETGKVATFDAPVQLANGEKSTQPVTRVGAFNLVSNGKYLKYDAASETLQELVRQPASRFQDSVSDLQSADSGLTAFGLDPSRGAILGLLVQAPSFSERVDQGGFVGYFTLGVGALGLLFIIERLIFLFLVGRKVKAQIKSDQISLDNPLGRVLAVYEDNKSVDTETLELKLDEAIMKEMPALERFLTLIKLISAVAPLLGLLGTVTGMINTFQAMTLFGTGDPKLMAGGISQALVTTVIGLVVALPTLFMHSIVSGWSKRIVHTLEEQSAGIIAVHAEQEHGNANP